MDQSVKDNKESVKIGDCVVMKPENENEKSYVAKVIIIRMKGGEVEVGVNRYYRPEDIETTIHSSDSIERKCKVHTIDEYTALKVADEDDFYCRAVYDPKIGDLVDDTTYPQYCKKCIWPQNPDYPMIQCGKCKFWFHSGCAKPKIRFLCELRKEYSCKECKTKSSTRA